MAALFFVAMKITATHTRAFVGTDISVSVECDAHESLGSIDVEYDGDTLDETSFDPGTDSYTRSFSQVGQAGPGDDHTLTVTASDAEGKPHTSVTRWTDTI
jgi:hypothetical protein